MSADTLQTMEQSSPTEEGFSPGLKTKLAQKLHLVPPGPVRHERTQEYVGASTHAVIEEVFSALGGAKGMKIAENMVRAQVQVVAREALSEQGRQTSRLSAAEAFTGTYDAVERKWQELYQKRPWFLGQVALAGGVFVVVFSVGMLLSIWRFVLFGLGPIYYTS